MPGYRETAEKLKRATDCGCDWCKELIQSALALLTEQEKELARLRRSELDNHHNAAACPYCRPTLEAEQKELVRLRQERDDATAIAESRWAEINIHIEAIRRINNLLGEQEKELDRLRAENAELHATLDGIETGRRREARGTHHD